MHRRAWHCIGGCLTPSCLLQAVHETGVFQNGQRVPTFRDRFGDSNNFQQSGNEEPWVRVFVRCSAAQSTCMVTAEQSVYPLLQAPALIKVHLNCPRKVSQCSQSISTPPQLPWLLISCLHSPAVASVGAGQDLAAQHNRGCTHQRLKVCAKCHYLAGEKSAQHLCMLRDSPFRSFQGLHPVVVAVAIACLRMGMQPVVKLIVAGVPCSLVSHAVAWDCRLAA